MTVATAVAEPLTVFSPVSVSDNGAAMDEETAAGLFLGPVASESGYGIGLFQAARHARAAGYRLELAENRTGRVCFRLARAA